MDLIERAGFLTSLESTFRNVEKGEGHCVLVAGEAGIGKTSLVKALCKQLQDQAEIFQGSCDALFTPRPLAPLYDIAWQMNSQMWGNKVNTSDRGSLFTSFFHELENQQQATLIVIEDIHWADEATLDFIKFLARRITRVRCLFLLTYRDDEIQSYHPLRNVLGQLPPDSFSRMRLTPLSKQSVERLAQEKGYNGEDVYSITAGNPFYVTEILASYSAGIPDNIKDSILSVYNRLDEKTKQVWQILSVLPTGFELKYLAKMEPFYATAIENCLDCGIVVSKGGLIFFKHELYRRTVEVSLSPLLRIALNKKILELFVANFEENGELERIVHHAKNANEYELVVEYAPLAARKAAALGAHIEASRLYLSAIEYYQGNDKDLLIQFYHAYAYECYLTNQIKDAIVYQERALRIWKEKNDIGKMGDCMRFLSRLWWFDGNRKKAENYAAGAVDVFRDQPPSRMKAMSLSNMSQLKMLSYEYDDCITWGEQAIAMANELNDDEILCHALNNVGTTQSRVQLLRPKGVKLLQQSLSIALSHSFDDHAARAYTNLVSNAVKMKDYVFAKQMLEEGIQYCEERDLDSYVTYLLAFKARFALETGNWKEAFHIATNIIKNEQLPIVKIEALIVAATIKMRRGEKDSAELLTEAKQLAFEIMEPQRIIPTITALLEYEWLMGTSLMRAEDLEYAVNMIEYRGNIYEKNEFAFWLMKARNQHVTIEELFEGYQVSTHAMARKASDFWKRLGCPYDQAITLFGGTEADKKEAILIVQNLGAQNTYEKLKFSMRASGIKNIPRGIRKSTRSNPANLTERELDVLKLLKEGLQNREIANRLYISAKTVDHHISSIFFKLDVNSRTKAVQEAVHLAILK